MLLQMVGSPSFLRLNDILFYVYATFSLSIHSSMDILVVFTSRLQIVLG